MLWETRGNACNFGRWERGCSSGTGETREDLSSWGGGRSFPGSCGSPHCPAFSGPGAEHRVLQGSQRQCPSVTRCPGRDTAPSCGRSSWASCSRDPSVRTSQGGGRRPRPQKGGGGEKEGLVVRSGTAAKRDCKSTVREVSYHQQVMAGGMCRAPQLQVTPCLTH